MTGSEAKTAAIGFLQQIVAGDVKGAYDRYVSPDLRHHNPYFPGDAASLRKGMEEDEIRCPGKQLIVVNALEDGERVAIHSRLMRPDGSPEIAVVHLSALPTRRSSKCGTSPCWRPKRRPTPTECSEGNSHGEA